MAISLASVSLFLRDTIEDLMKQYRAVREGNPPSAKDIKEKSGELRRWALLAIEEQAKINELIGKLNGGGSGHGIDLADARAQIGRRLARIAAARAPRSVSE